MNTEIKLLETRGLIEVQYPKDLRIAVDKTVQSWKDFCALPVDIKQTLPYSNNSDGVGYELKEGVGNKADRKENFDIAIGGQKWLEENISKIKDPTVLRFLKDAVSLIGIMKPLVVDFADQSESAFSIVGLKKEVEESVGGFFVRFIHYFGNRKVGEEIASAHVDQSGFTPHLFESDSGLQCLTFDNKWIDMPVSAGQTVIIPSMQMQLRSKGRLKALCHRVVATAETAKNGRFSAVCFVQFKDTQKYDKDTHGRLQEMVPGFNYQMSFERFSELFISK